MIDLLEQQLDEALYGVIHMWDDAGNIVELRDNWEEKNESPILNGSGYAFQNITKPS